eukprot:3126125-Prymnesium_polylepis.2
MAYTFGELDDCYAGHASVLPFVRCVRHSHLFLSRFALRFGAGQRTTAGCVCVHCTAGGAIWIGCEEALRVLVRSCPRNRMPPKV